MSAQVQNFDRIPVIDIGGLTANDPASYRKVVDEVRRASSEVGFFYITGHGCPPGLRDRILARAKEFFALPMERKMKAYIGKSKNHRGYVPPGEEVFAGSAPDSKEAFDFSLDLPLSDPAVQRNPHMLGPNQWPDLDGFSADATAYYAAMFVIGKRLLQAFAAALDLPKDHFDGFVTAPPSQMRMIHYPHLAEEPADRPGIGAHTDYECFTLLFGTTPGLEVMNGAGTWIDAPPLPGAFVVNIGDLMEYWSGGKFVATSHRVRKVQQERYSFPLFFCVDYDTKVAPLDAGLDAGEGAAPLVAGDHLYAQTIQTFQYLKKRLEDGEIAMPQSSATASFGHHSKQTENAG
jgi:isopenicillin N synthase-like dioxygenase